MCTLDELIAELLDGAPTYQLAEIEAAKAELARLRRIEAAARAFIEIHASLADGAQVRAKFADLYDAVDGGGS